MSNMPAPDRQAIADFLKLVHPEGPWVLTSIPAEGGKTATQTMFDIDGAATWAANQNTLTRNVYFTVNRIRGSMDVKPKKEHIEEAVMLHIDVDPRKPQPGMTEAELDEWNVGERARIISDLRAYRPEPTFIVDSGGGYQGFWKLDEPLYIGGDPNRINDLEAYNKQLGIDLSGDNAWNIDRILRCVGTVNWPNEEKRKKGRKATLAKLVSPDGPIHPLCEFTPVSQDAKSSNVGGSIDLPRDIPRADLEGLPAAVTQRTRMLIVQGDDPDDPNKYGSKSEVMWAVTCEMVRAGCTDTAIASVLLDAELGISDHPLRQKRSVEYVARQIERAREEVAEPMLHELNSKHFAVGSIGGKFRIASWRRSEIDAGREMIEYQTVGDFANRYMHRRVQVGTAKGGNPMYAPAGKWWLSHPMRRQYETVAFAPNEQLDELEAFNLWRGLAVEAQAGEWPLLRRLIWEALASADDTNFDYIMRWLAFAVQQPERPAEVALVLRGGRGIGKSTVGHVMRKIFGQHGLNVTHSHHLHGNFNDHLHDCCLLFADEAVAPDDRKAEQMIKVMITDPTLLIEPKGLGVFMATNRLHVIMASNERWVVPAGEDERRFAVFDVSPHLKVPPGASADHPHAQYWTALYREMEGGGIGAFLRHLLDMDLTDWHPRRGVPQTGGLLDQKVSSLRDFPRVWFEILASGELPDMPATQDYGGDHVFISTRQLWNYARAAQTRSESITETSVGMFLDDMGFRKVENARPRGYVLPPLSDARKAWDERMFRFGWGAARAWDLDGGRGDDGEDEPY